MPLITVTFYMGTGGRNIAERAAQELNLEFYDDMKFQAEARKTGISSEGLANLQERLPGFWGRLWQQRPHMYIDLMVSVVYDIAKRGHGVIIGHGGQVLLSNFDCAFHILVQAPEEKRIERLVDEQSISRESAEKLIRKADHEQRGFFHFAFQKDLNDPALYDLVLNTAKLKEDEAVKIIVETAQSDTVKECSLLALDAMEKLSLAKKVEAALLSSALGVLRFHVEVSEKGIVDLLGFTYSKEERDSLLEVVKRVRGVKEVRANVSVVQPGY